VFNKHDNIESPKDFSKSVAQGRTLNKDLNINRHRDRANMNFVNNLRNRDKSNWKIVSTNDENLPARCGGKSRLESPVRDKSENCQVALLHNNYDYIIDEYMDLDQLKKVENKTITLKRKDIKSTAKKNNDLVYEALIQLLRQTGVKVDIAKISQLSSKELLQYYQKLFSEINKIH